MTMATMMAVDNDDNDVDGDNDGGGRRLHQR
jgi:hypothetical protein